MKERLLKVGRLAPIAFGSVIEQLQRAQCESSPSSSNSRLSGRPIHLSKDQIKPLPWRSTNRGFYVVNPMGDCRQPTHKPTPLVRCKVQEFASERLSEFMIGSLYHHIDDNLPSPYVLYTKGRLLPVNLFNSECHICFTYKAGRNLEDFLLNDGLSTFNQDQKRQLFAQLIAWVRMDVALNKHIHTPNYIVVGDNIVSVDHESFGDYLYDFEMPSVEACLALVFGQLPPKELLDWIGLEDQQALIEEKTVALIEKFIEFQDFEDLKHKTLAAFSQELDTQELDNKIQIIKNAQAKTKLWLTEFVI